jgi:mRNA interferase RelE/StbE
LGRTAKRVRFIMSWKIIFTKRAEKDLKSLSPEVRKTIAKAINTRLLPNPDSALLPLKGKLKGIYKFRVGTYRILCERRSKTLVIVVVKIGHRKEIYG